MIKLDYYAAKDFKNVMKKIIYGLFDVANSPFTIIVITFIFGPYFAKEIVGDPVKGAAYWQWTSGLCAITIAIFGTILGSISDNIKNGRKYFFILSTTLCIAITTFFIMLCLPRITSFSH